MAKNFVNAPYKVLYDPTIHNVIANTPRASAKSYEIAQYCQYQKMRYAYHDIVVFRANANSLEASVINEILEKFVQAGYGDRVERRSKPLRIEYTSPSGFVSNIYFIGVSGHDKSRVRGFKPKNPLCLILGDECQQITAEDNLRHALATLKGYFDNTIAYKTVLAGNPHEVKGHWWNVYCMKHRSVKGYAFIDCTYRDVFRILNEEIKEEIRVTKETNPAMYRFMFLGDLTDISAGAYPSFRREKHLISEDEAREIFKDEIIDTMIIGFDGAITHDSTCGSSLAIMSGGRSVVLEPFVFDPLAYGRALAPSELAELIKGYLSDLEAKYQFQLDGVPVYLAVDCASADLIAQLRYVLDDCYTVLAYTQKNVIRNTNTVNNVFARNMCYIINYKCYKDYTTGTIKQKDIPLLVEQLESVVWKNSKLDPAIPNDCSDSLVYGICTWYENPHNLNLPERKIKYD
jgi:hypothetical protein